MDLTTKVSPLCLTIKVSLLDLLIKASVLDLTTELIFYLKGPSQGFFTGLGHDSCCIQASNKLFIFVLDISPRRSFTSNVVFEHRFLYLLVLLLRCSFTSKVVLLALEY